MKRLVLLLAILCAITVRAEDPDKNALALKLLESMDFCGMLDRNFDEMKAAQLKQIQRMGAMAGRTSTDDVERTFALIKEAMDCESVKAETAAAYADIFTAEELKGLTEFYESELGQSFNKKQPDIMRRTMEISARRLNEAMPRIMQSVQKSKSADAPVKPVELPVKKPVE